MKTRHYRKRVDQLLLAVALVNIVAAGVFATSAADGVGPGDRVEIRPADTASGDQYTSVVDGQLQIQIDNLNRQAVTDIGDLFVIENKWDGPADVYVQHNQSDRVTFYAMNSGTAISGSENNVSLEKGESILVGIKADSTTGSIDLREITFQARVPDRKGGGGSSPRRVTPEVAVEQTDVQVNRVNASGSEQTSATVSNVRAGSSVNINLTGGDTTDSPETDEVTPDTDSQDGATDSPETVENSTSVTESPSTVPGSLDSLEAQYMTGGESEFSITRNDEPTNPTPDGSVATSSYSIERGGDAQMVGANLRFSVEKSVVEARGLDLDSARAIRAPTPDSEWQILETEQVGTTDDAYVFRARTPGFSEFTLTFNESDTTASQLTVPATASADDRVPIVGQITNNQRQATDVQLNLSGANGTVYNDTVTVEPDTTVDISRSIRLSPGEYTVNLGSQSQTVTVTPGESPEVSTPASNATATTETEPSTEVPTVVQREVSPDVLVMALLVSGLLLGLLALRRRFN